MSEMVERVAMAMAESIKDPVLGAMVWKHLYEDGDEFDDTSRAYWRSLARAAIEAMREPTQAMQKAGFFANRFENKHGETFGCPGVKCSVEAPSSFAAWVEDEPAKLKAWLGAPKCLVARVTIPADKPWAAMIDAALNANGE